MKLTVLAVRAYSHGSIDAHRWAFAGFLGWAHDQGHASPAAFTRSTLEAYQLHLHLYHSPRTRQPLIVNTQLARLGCIRRFFAWLCHTVFRTASLRLALPLQTSPPPPEILQPRRNRPPPRPPQHHRPHEAKWTKKRTICGHERLLAFTCKGRHFCPACHQRRTRTIGEWIATGVCHEVPHRQFVFTIPKVLRGIFRKRRHLLTHLFQTATTTLRDSFRTRLNLPEGKLGAIAGVHTFGDYLIFHPHLHVLAADGLFDSQGRFHCMPAEDLAPAIELFRHRFLYALRDAKLISPGKLADLLSWKHSGFHIDNGGEKPVPTHDSAGRRRLAEYLFRHPFSLQKITWNATTKTVIYRSKRHHNTKRNFEIFTAPDFIAAALLHLPPKGQRTVRYYGMYSNKTRGQISLIPDRIIRPPESSSNQQSKINNPQSEIPSLQSEILLVPAPPKQSARDMRPLWRDLILKVWGGDPLQCPCCKGTMKPARKVIRREEIEFFLRLHGLWEGLIQ